MADQTTKILIVDDHPNNITVLESYLRPEGYLLLRALSGMEAIRVVSEHKPDLVLLDVLMPDMDGFETCRRIKEMEGDTPLPVIMITALSGQEDKIKGIRSGADDFITKPADHAELLARVRSLLRLRRMALDLREERDRLRDSDMTRSTLEQMIVHDLKAPVGVIQNSLEMMETLGPKPKYIHMARRACDEMLSLISNIIEIGALEEGNLTVVLVWREIGEFLWSKQDYFESLAAAQGVRLSIEVPDVLGKFIIDKHLFSRILGNLITNAAKHSPKDSAVTLAAAVSSAGVLNISVSDEGDGVPEHYRKMIFDKYMQLDIPKEAGDLNYGLGLTFCKLAVDAHGGTIRVEDNPGGGARFVIELPNMRMSRSG